MTTLAPDTQAYLDKGGTLTNGQVPTQSAPTGTDQNSPTVVSSAISVDSLNTPPVTPPVIPPTPVDTTNHAAIIAGAVPPVPDIPTSTDTSTPVTNSSTGLLNKIKDLMGLDTGKAQYTQDQLDASGATKLTARQNEISGQLTALSNEANGIPDKVQLDNTGAGVVKAATTARTADALRVNAIKALTLKSEYDVNAGNLQNAKDNAQRAIDLKYSDIETQIDNSTKLLQLYTPFMSAEQKAKADALTLANTQKATDLADAKKSQTDVVNAAQTAASAGIKSASQLASQALALDPNSSTFKADLAAIQAKIPATTQKGSYQVVKGSTDAYGNPMPDRIFDSTTGKFISGGSGGGIVDTTISNGVPIIGSGGNGIGSATGKPLSFDQYGLLANTDYNPSNLTDQLSQKYLDQYIKNGTVPTASSLGRNMKPEAMAQVDSRARDLYFKATGTALPNPQIIKGYQAILDANNKLANNLQIQEQTVQSNVDFSLQNMKANGLNSSQFAPLNGVINSVEAMFNDPATQQLIAQNTTIQNELGSLLAVKNASGTTVYDKLSSAGIIKNTDTPASIKTKVVALIQEAHNFADSLKTANASLYKQVDPFLQDPNNPARTQMKVESALNKIGANYNDIIAKIPAGQIPVLNKDGQVGYISPAEFNSVYYTKL